MSTKPVPVIVNLTPSGNLEITSIHKNTGNNHVIIEHADMFDVFVAIRDRLVDDDICLACGTHTLDRACPCENDE